MVCHRKHPHFFDPTEAGGGEEGYPQTVVLMGGSEDLTGLKVRHHGS